MPKLFTVRGNELFAGDGRVSDDNEFTLARKEREKRLSEESLDKRRVENNYKHGRRARDREWLPFDEWVEQEGRRIQ